MAKITTTVSFEEDEYGRGEVSSFSREVEDLDPVDFLWYLLKVAEVAGWDVKDIHMVTNSGRFYTTEE